MDDTWEVVPVFQLGDATIWGLAKNERIVIKWSAASFGLTWHVYLPEDERWLGEFTSQSAAERFARDFVKAPGVTDIPPVFRDS